MVMIIGHRGARNLWPENSIEGFRKLVAMGVEGVEFDVHQTSDDAIVVIHDPTLERTTLGSGPVGEKTAAALHAIALRDSNECIPSLDDVLAVLKEARLELHVEIKTDAVGNAYPGLESRVIAALERYDLMERTILTCFVPEVLETVRKVREDARVLISLDRRSAEMMGGIARAFDRIDRIPGCFVAVEKALLAQTFEYCVSRIGPERLGAWVTNDEVDIADWMSRPIRQITTDRPDLALAFRQARKVAVV